MKSIRVHEHGSPQVMALEDIPDPQPGAGEVVIQVQAAGVNPVDTYIRSGLHGYTADLPYTPGIDAAGVVESVGDGATNISVGDRVYCAGTISGSYAERTVCHSADVHSLPESVSFAQGACVGVPYGTAYRALFQRARVEPGEVVLVHGASGGVGLAAVQLARTAGMTVIGTAGSEEGSSLVTEHGANYVLDHRAPNHLGQALDITGGQGVDVILEMLANVNLGNDLPALAMGGRVVVIGSRGVVEINPRDTMSRDASIVGMSLRNASASEFSSIHAYLVAGLSSGTLRPSVGKKMPLADAAAAHRKVMESPAYANITLIP